MNSKQRFRARIILGGIIVAAFGLGVTLYNLQITRGSEYVAKVEKQVKLPLNFFDRGSIMFTAKDGTHSSAATLSSNYLVYVNPKLIKDAQGTYQALSQYIKIDREQFLRKSALLNDPYEELAKKIDASVAQQVSSLSLNGIGVVKETIRLYPGANLAAHVLGIVGESDGTIEGRYGLERTYENILSRPYVSSSANIFAQLFTNTRNSILSADFVRGDIVTTIEPTVQGYLEKVLDETNDQWKPDEIGGIIMDPKTGNIFAMASLPDFDPNDISKIKNIGILSNPLVEYAYEMGSIMKPLSVAIGFDSSALTPTWTYDDTGKMTLSGKNISNFDGKARGPTTSIQEILSQSLNVGSATVALEVGKQAFVRYFTALGFGSKTGVDQPNETVGLVANLKTGRDIEIATMAYGQGIALSPMAMTRALAVLANNGKIVKQRLVQEIDYVDGTKKIITPDVGVQVLKPETVETVTRMLVKVVDEALRKGALRVEHYTVAAKTGTAQIADSTTKGYYQDRYLHSFFGYFPAYEPKFIVFLYQKYPKGAQYASETLAEPFGELTKFLIDYYNVPPDR